LRPISQKSASMICKNIPELQPPARSVSLGRMYRSPSAVGKEDNRENLEHRMQEKSPVSRLYTE
jgi:hypothetical protein